MCYVVRNSEEIPNNLYPRGRTIIKYKTINKTQCLKSRLVREVSRASNMDLERLSGGMDSAPPARKPMSLSGKILIGLTGGIGIGVTVICYPFVAPAFRKYCLPYVPATTTQVENILVALRQTTKVGKLIDIGSGDGRIVIAAARQGFQSDGVELNPWLVQYSRIAALTNGVSSKTAFYQRDLWKFDLSSYRNIVIFGVEQMMEALEAKLLNEVHIADSKVIVCRFPLPNLEANCVIGGGVDTVWVYDLRNPVKRQSTAS